MILLDSNILIYTLQHVPKAEQLMRSLSEPPFVSTISVMELYHGTEDDYDKIKAAMLLEKCELIPVDHHIAKKAGELLNMMKKGGKTTKRKEDMLIAATALSLGAPLVSANWKDFQHIPGLKLEKFIP